MNVSEAIEILRLLPPETPFCRIDPMTGEVLEIVSMHREVISYKSKQGHVAHEDAVYVK
ncbi:hypothetical protein G6L37_02660 [Agrobacterium rubi]|nr:hypothetical protein [Agrobacterium rubi]NTF24298.1 hypothetical protein [Agrobacterium rubi]